MMNREEIAAANASEAKRRHLTGKIQKLRGQQEATGHLAKLLSDLSYSTGEQRKQAEAELQKLNESGMTDMMEGWGRLSAVEVAARDARFAAKRDTYRWLTENRAATLEETAKKLDEVMMAQRTEIGRPWLVFSGAGLLLEWKANAYAARRIEVDSWEVFRDFLLEIGEDAATNPSW